MAEIWVSKDKDGTYVSKTKPEWDTEKLCWFSNPPNGIRIPAHLAGIKVGQCAQIVGLMVDYRTLEEQQLNYHRINDSGFKPAK